MKPAAALLLVLACTSGCFQPADLPFTFGSCDLEYPEGDEKAANVIRQMRAEGVPLPQIRDSLKAGDPRWRCSAGLGSCERDGVFACTNGELLCNAQPTDPASEEICRSNIDEDCDGALDEAPTDDTCCSAEDCDGTDTCKLMTDEMVGRCVAAVETQP